MIEQRGPWQKLSSKIVHENPFFYVHEDEVIRPDGQPGQYNVVETRGAVFVIALDTDGAFYLIGQHRYTIDKFSLELPAGGIEHGDDPLEDAKRELAEEAGLAAKTWKLLGVTYPAKGLLNEPNYSYLATNLTHIGEDSQAEEGITELRKVTFAEFDELLLNGTIHDTQTIATVARAKLELERS